MPTIGSQALVRLLPRTRYDLSALRDAVVQIPVAQHIDVLGFERATLQVRIYSGTLPAKSAVQIQLADDGFNADEPAGVFLQTTTATGEPIGALQVREQTVFPFYQSISTPIPGVLGRLMAVLVSFSGGSKGGPTVELGLDLVLTGGTVGGKISQPSTYLGYAHEAVEPVETFERLSSDVAAAEPGLVADRLAAQVATAVRDALARADPDPNDPRGGYARFGNVNIGKEAVGQRPDVGEERLTAVLSNAVRDALVRGGLDFDTPDGGYARFGNVNVGIGGNVEEPEVGEGRLAAVLASAIREALRRGDLDVATAGGGYARFGNVNIGIGGPIDQPDILDAPGPEQDG